MSIEAEDRRRSDALVHMADMVGEFKTTLQQIENKREAQDNRIFDTLNDFGKTLNAVNAHVSRLSGVMERGKNEHL